MLAERRAQAFSVKLSFALIKASHYEIGQQPKAFVWKVVWPSGKMIYISTYDADT